MAPGGHWTTPWLGLPWIEGEHECSHFVAEVLEVEFAVYLDLPAPEASIRGRDRQIARGLGSGRALPIVDPHDGDGVLTVLAGGRRVRDWHIGIYVDAGEPLMLHCPRGGTSCVTPIRDLAALGQALEGYYRWVS